MVILTIPDLLVLEGLALFLDKLVVLPLALQPVRSAVLACGFGAGIAAMAGLLGIGEVILEQSRAPALQGGLGAPIVGDTLYASEEVAAWLDRLALHAAHLAFWNPSGGGDWLKFDTPPDF